MQSFYSSQSFCPSLLVLCTKIQKKSIIIIIIIIIIISSSSMSPLNNTVGFGQS